MKVKRRTLEKTRNWALALAAVLLIGFSYRLYVEKDWFTISSYSVVGVDEVDKKEIISRLKDTSSGATFFFLPHNKILSYSHAAIVNVVSEVVPSRKNIIIRPDSLTSLSVTIEEFVPVMRLNDGVGITKDGVIFTTKRSLETLPLFESASSTVLFKENGFTFTKFSSFDEKYLESLVLFLEKISSTVFRVTKIVIDQVGDIHLYGQNNSEILLTKDTDLDKGWTTLLSAIDTDPLKSSLLKEKEKLVYIDLRYGNKVFYKFDSGGFLNASSAVIIDDHVTPIATTTLFQ